MLVLRLRYFISVHTNALCVSVLLSVNLTWYLLTQNHRFSYGEPMTVESATQAICDLALRFGEGDEESMVSLTFICVI
jgi:hypothetical protein